MAFLAQTYDKIYLNNIAKNLNFDSVRLREEYYKKCKMVSPEFKQGVYDTIQKSCNIVKKHDGFVFLISTNKWEFLLELFLYHILNQDILNQDIMQLVKDN